MNSPRSEDLLLLRGYASRGDVAAFSRLVRRYADMVYATARRVTGSATAAEDVSQDCFLRLAQSSSLIRGSLGAWLHRTSVNRSLEINRAERARRLREAGAAQKEAEHDRAGDEAATLLSRIDEALAFLPEDLRVLVSEHYLCGRSQTELAAQLGVNQSTVHRRIEKGLEQLRRQLKDEAGEESLSLLPMLLLEFCKTSAPAALRQSLTKIALSGIGAGSAASARTSGVVVTMKWIGAALAVLVAMAGGAVVYRAQTDPAWRGAATPTEVTLSVDQLPAPVRKTLDQFTVPAAATPSQSTVSFSSIERKRSGQHTVYDIDALIAARTWELRIQEDGTLIWKKPG